MKRLGADRRRIHDGASQLRRQAPDSARYQVPGTWYQIPGNCSPILASIVAIAFDPILAKFDVSAERRPTVRVKGPTHLQHKFATTFISSPENADAGRDERARPFPGKEGVFMSEQTPASASGTLALPDAPNLEWLRKQAKQRLKELRQADPGVKLADAQRDLARRYGFPSWRALKAHVDSLTIDGQLFDAARKGDVETLRALLDAHPDKVYVRNQPYEHTLLHVAAHNGRLEPVELLLKRGIDPNTREKGDNTYAMHWAAAAGHLDVVRMLADAGGDVVGDGDDHALQVIGWATGWEGGDDATHRALADFLISRGARHHIYSAMALNDADEIRRIVTEHPSQLERPQSHNENFRRPLHFAVHKKLREMIALLLELGADPLGTDASGFTAVAYATDPEIDAPVLEAIRRRIGPTLLTSLGLNDWESAAQIIQREPSAVEKNGVLHLLAKRGSAAAVKWLLARGANPNALWNHWGALVTPLHLAALSNHTEVARELLDAGADSTIRDSMHDSDALSWANFFQRREIAALIERSGRARGLAK